MYRPMKVHHHEVSCRMSALWFNLMCIGPFTILITEEKIQIDVTYYIIMLMLGSTCFGHHCAHRQDLTTIALVTT